MILHLILRSSLLLLCIFFVLFPFSSLIVSGAPSVCRVCVLSLLFKCHLHSFVLFPSLACSVLLCLHLLISPRTRSSHCIDHSVLLMIAIAPTAIYCICHCCCCCCTSTSAAKSPPSQPPASFFAVDPSSLNTSNICNPAQAKRMMPH